jgi:hypothetical protein
MQYNKIIQGRILMLALQGRILMLALYQPQGKGLGR